MKEELLQVIYAENKTETAEETIVNLLNDLITRIETDWQEKQMTKDRKKNAVSQWQRKWCGEPPKTGKRRSWPDKEKNYLISSFQKFVPPAGCRSIY